MNTPFRTLAHIASALIIILSLITVSHASLPANAVQKNSDANQTKLRMLFAGSAHTATIYPFAHASDLFLIDIKNVKDIVMFAEAPDQFADSITLSELAEKLWQRELLNACIIGTFNIDNTDQTKSYVFELSNPSYNNKSKTFSVHAKSLGGKNLPAFSTKKPIEVTEISFFIDPILVGNTFHGL